MADEGEQSWQRLLNCDVVDHKVVTERSDPPANFHFPYLVGRATPYRNCDGEGREQISGGVLDADQVVWLEQSLQTGQTSRHVTAFTPTAGVIRLDARGWSVARSGR